MKQHPNNPAEFHATMRLLKNNRFQLTKQQFRTLKGQCLAGDVEGAKKGFYKIIRNEGVKQCPLKCSF